MNKIKVWTFQSIKVLGKIKKSNYKGSSFHFAKKYWDDNFVIAYQWLDQKTFKNKRSPVFVWLKKPDLRKNEFKKQENLKKMVLIEIEIDKNQVVNVDFFDWWYVLGLMPLRNELIYKQLEKKYKKYDYNAMCKKDKDKVKSTWIKVFKKRQKNQAIIPLISWESITKITYFN